MCRAPVVPLFPIPLWKANVNFPPNRHELNKEKDRLIHISHFAGWAVMRWQVEHPFLVVTRRLVIALPIYSARFRFRGVTKTPTLSALVLPVTEDFQARCIGPKTKIQLTSGRIAALRTMREIIRQSDGSGSDASMSLDFRLLIAAWKDQIAPVRSPQNRWHRRTHNRASSEEQFPARWIPEFKVLSGEALKVLTKEFPDTSSDELTLASSGNNIIVAARFGVGSHDCQLRGTAREVCDPKIQHDSKDVAERHVLHQVKRIRRLMEADTLLLITGRFVDELCLPMPAKVIHDATNDILQPSKKRRAIDKVSILNLTSDARNCRSQFDCEHRRADHVFAGETCKVMRQGPISAQIVQQVVGAAGQRPPFRRSHCHQCIRRGGKWTVVVSSQRQLRFLFSHRSRVWRFFGLTECPVVRNQSKNLSDIIPSKCCSTKFRCRLLELGGSENKKRKS